MNTLKYVRPGAGYVPNFPLSQKIEVNGDGAHPLFKWLRTVAPENDTPSSWLTNTTPGGLVTTAAAGSDIRWNFEKFLVGKDGTTVQRFKHTEQPADMKAAIEAMLG